MAHPRPDTWIARGNPGYRTGDDAWTRNAGPCARSFADTFQERHAYAAYGDGRSDANGVSLAGESHEMWAALEIADPPTLVAPQDVTPTAFSDDAFVRIARGLLHHGGAGAVAIIGVQWRLPDGTSGVAGGHFFNAFVDTTLNVWWADLLTGRLGLWPLERRLDIDRVQVALRPDHAPTWQAMSL